MRSSRLFSKKSPRWWPPLKWLLIACCLGYGLAWALPGFAHRLPLVPYVVQSGSMAPAIMAGDLILISPAQSYQQRDVITFRNSRNRVVTHRIDQIDSALGQTIYLTKGDANPAQDQEVVPQEQVLGSVTLVIPKLGRLVAWGKTRWGALLLIVIPAVIIVYDEYRHMQKRLK